MKQTKIIMGMPITIEIVDRNATPDDLTEIFDYFFRVDKKFSPFKKNSEVSRINNHMVSITEVSPEMRQILDMCDKTKKETQGYFDPYHNGKFDPSGIVKGWSIKNASEKLKEKGYKNFYIEAGGDIQVFGKNQKGEKWRVGIRNPFNKKEVIKVIFLTDGGVATSGEYERGEHIYNPHSKTIQKEIVSITVVSSNILNADRFATAAFVMGNKGITFLEKQKNLEGYMINSKGVATFTSGFERFNK